jgi:predicted amidohydrolase
MFQLSLIQMQVEGGRLEQNLARASQRVKQAAANGAQVVLLPEAMDLGWTHPSAKTQAGGIPEGSTFKLLQNLARAHQVYLCSGLTERSGDTVFNAAVLLSPKGELLLHHRKLNELEIGHDCYAQGDRLSVAHTPLGTFGLMICADAFAKDQIVSRTLGLMGADIILSPSAWAVPADHDNVKEPYGQLWLDNYTPVARDFQMWIAGCSNVGHLTAGPWQGRRCIGCSLVVGPDGKQVLMGPYGSEAETILHVPITPRTRPARGDGWERLWNKPIGAHPTPNSSGS